jgi:predicted membrane-bound spermidine synthase
VTALRVVKEGAAYFALVFGAGFLLGTVRTLWLVPRIGARSAELLEMPVMLAVAAFAARWVVRRFAVPPQALRRLAVGLVALILLVGAELTIVLRLRGLTLSEFLAHRDPVAETAYRGSLVLVAVLPVLVARKGIARA